MSKSKHLIVPETGIEDSWSLFQGEYDGKPLIARVNTALISFVSHPQYQHQVGVAVPFHSPDENGFPSSEESSQLTMIEDLLCSELEDRNESLFAVVITMGGMREFVFYTSNPGAVEAKFKEVRQKVQSHQIQGMIRPDENWDVYRQFV
jgi:hypothetical protein